MPIPDLDYAPVTEELRRLLYAAAVKLAFSGNARKEALPDYSPDDGGLTVFHMWGRWFAVWYDSDSESLDLPPYRRWQVVRIKAKPSRPEGIEFQEI